MAFGMKGAIVSSIVRGIPAIVWYGFQSWIGATGLNEMLKIATNGAFDSIPTAFAALMVVQIFLSLKGFHTIKWVNTLIALILFSAYIYAFTVIANDYGSAVKETWIDAEGTWGIPFWSFTVAFLGNYAALMLSSSDYSRELKPGVSAPKRFMMYFSPVALSYFVVTLLGIMLVSATGQANPVEAFAQISDNKAITFIVSFFIMLGAVGVNLVANIVPAAYIIQVFTKAKYKTAVIAAGVLAMGSFPWKLISESSSEGLHWFILIYSAFIGPITAILLVDYIVLRKKKVEMAELYNHSGMFSGLNKAAVIAMTIGAVAAFAKVDIGWFSGMFFGGLSYYWLSKVAFKDSPFRKGTIFEKPN